MARFANRFLDARFLYFDKTAETRGVKASGQMPTDGTRGRPRGLAMRHHRAARGQARSGRLAGRSELGAFRQADRLRQPGQDVGRSAGREPGLAHGLHELPALHVVVARIADETLDRQVRVPRQRVGHCPVRVVDAVERRHRARRA